MKKIYTLILALTALAAFHGTAHAANQDQSLSQYQFSQTKSLVKYVRKAANVFHEKGSLAFSEFRHKNGEWYDKSRYLFIYDLKGNNVFHAAQPALEGKNIIDFKDINGKPVIKAMISMVNNNPNASGWVHYLWTGPDHIFPVWKSSYVTKVTGPNSKPYFIGSGIYNMRNERVFVKNAVDSVVSMLKTKGLPGLVELADKSKPYIFKGVYPFVMDTKGNLYFDPAFPQGRIKRNLYHFKDATGKQVIKSVINKMKTMSSIWMMYMWPKPNQSEPAKKLMYVRRVDVAGKTLLVGSELFVETPLWMG